MNVSAIIVTRGDVDCSPILEVLPDWETLIWNNGEGKLWVFRENGLSELHDVNDLSVYGRYAAIEYASNDLIYVQDDDVLHTPEGIREMVSTWHDQLGRESRAPAEFVVCNMPANFRHAFYQEHALVGFGAAFHRDAPRRALVRFSRHFPDPHALGTPDFFHRTCDIIFTALTPRVLVDVPYEDLPWASAENRMWKQPTHREERGRMLDLVLQVRDG